MTLVDFFYKLAKNCHNFFLFVDTLTSADYQLPEWPSVLKFDKFGQTDYLSALFPEMSDIDFNTQIGQITVQSTDIYLKWDGP